MKAARHPWAAAVERDFVAAWWLLAVAADVERSDEPHLRWFHAGVPDMHLNAVLVTDLDDDGADAVIDETLARMRERGAPFIWWVMPSSRPSDLAARLRARGLVDDARWPAYAIAAGELADPPRVDGLEIRRVSSQDDLNTYLGVYAPILSPSPAFTELFTRAARRIGFGEAVPEEHFIGLLRGEPVATVSLVTAGGAAGIYNVTTVEAARGRGIGAAMTVAAARYGAERGFGIATLQASTMGRPVYERLGFQFVCDLHPYREP
ncbi:MAG: GNAT family N-acetyltransferase [Chloroflexota bacterium]|nr:GNAT family N-acetyltransferase [Chloroflexota bacterium]